MAAPGPMPREQVAWRAETGPSIGHLTGCLFCRPLCTDWHRVNRFHVGTVQCEPTSDAG